MKEPSPSALWRAVAVYATALLIGVYLIMAITIGTLTTNPREAEQRRVLIVENVEINDPAVEKSGLSGRKLRGRL